MSKIKSIPAWAWRKSLYYTGAAVVAIFGAFGILSEVQVDQWTEQIDKILPYVLGVLIPLFAGSKTHPGSDSTATDKDVAGAQYDATFAARSAAEQTADAIAAKVEELKEGAPDVAATLKELTKAIPDQVTPAKIADAVLTAIRAEERGEHFTVTDPTAMVATMKTEAARPDYVYGRQ